MSIYSSTHAGLILDSTTISNLNLQETDLRGYFSKTDLISLLANNPTCAGIRIYNVNPNTNFPSLLAVCVMENGADMQAEGTHAICGATNDASNKAIVLSRQMAFDDIKRAYSFDVMESEKFSSYFSKTMLTNLFNSNFNDGIAFYKVIWLGGRSTHLAVSSSLNSDTTTSISGVNGVAFSNCLSDQPCPGHCANKDEEGNEIISPNPMTSTPNDLTSHYIPIWD